MALVRRARKPIKGWNRLVCCIPINTFQTAFAISVLLGGAILFLFGKWLLWMASALIHILIQYVGVGPKYMARLRRAKTLHSTRGAIIPIVASEIPSQNVIEPHRHEYRYLYLAVCRFCWAWELWAGWSRGSVSVAACSVPGDEAMCQ